jgi:hypothetical protein
VNISVEIFVANVPVSVYGDGSGVSHRYEPGIRNEYRLESEHQEKYMFLEDKTWCCEGKHIVPVTV